MQIPTFKNKQLLITALTHRSAINEHATASRESNERLEYLGDAVLELITSEFLYHQLPNTPEGKLTAIRSALVKTTTLSEVGALLGLPEMLYLSRGEEKNGGRQNETLIADTTEALIGAIYLDQGLDCVRDFIHETIFARYPEIVTAESCKDAKSLLQEQVQALGWTTPEYQTVGEVGPDHDKRFLIEVSLNGEILGTGEGRNKQTAQQLAASNALTRIASGEIILQHNPNLPPVANILDNPPTCVV